MADLEIALLSILVVSHIATLFKVWDCNMRVKRIEKVIVIEEKARIRK